MKKLLIVLLIAITLVVTASPVFGKAGLLVTGGGIIIEEHGKDSSKITFAFNVFQDNTGNIEINFHNVNVNSLDKGKFKSTSVTFEEGENDILILTAQGKLNGEDGWWIRINIKDYCEPGKIKPGSSEDPTTIRIRIDDDSNVNDHPIYDTALDFARYLDPEVPDPVWRTPLDGGNIQLHR